MMLYQITLKDHLERTEQQLDNAQYAYNELKCESCEREFNLFVHGSVYKLAPVWCPLCGSKQGESSC
jgi:DNA-directed RNA polymerase subunit RPC12/RpoP